MEVRWSAAVEQVHPPVGNFLVRVHVAVVVLIAVNELKKHKERLRLDEGVSLSEMFKRTSICNLMLL